MTAQDYGWGEPGCSRTVRVPCPGIPLNVRPEVAPLFAELVRWLTEQRARHGAPPLTSSGGYVLRPIRGYEIRYEHTKDPRYLSNHSWGTAADFNAGTNPMQDRLVTDMPPGTAEKASSLGMRWGGTYTARKDPMHFEVIVGPAEAARLIAALNSPDPQPEDDMTPQQAEQLANVERMLGELLRETAQLAKEQDMFRRDLRKIGPAVGVNDIES